jgi:hypothetical protein
MRSEPVKQPKAREKGIVVQELADEVLIYDLERHKAHCLNQTAATIWQSCDGQRTIADLAALLSARSNTKVDESFVMYGIEQLTKARLVEGDGSSAGKLSRREALRRIGIAAAIALPVVTSIIAPRAAEAGTCRASGQSCTSSLQCCSGLCAGSTCA